MRLEIWVAVLVAPLVLIVPARPAAPPLPNLMRLTRDGQPVPVVLRLE